MNDDTEQSLQKMKEKIKDAEKLAKATDIGDEDDDVPVVTHKKKATAAAAEDLTTMNLSEANDTAAQIAKVRA